MIVRHFNAARAKGFTAIRADCRNLRVDFRDILTDSDSVVRGKRRTGARMTR
jgi:hypothetical protein